MTNLFDPLSEKEQHFALASHLPIGEAWTKAFDTEDDFGKLLSGLSLEFTRFQNNENKLFNEMDINLTTELIEDWEKSVGIPDSCFDININLANRRIQVLQKFSKFGGVQKSEDFVRVADIFGFEIEIIKGSAVGKFPLIFPIPLFASTKSAVHTILIKLINLENTDSFPLLFPLNFSIGAASFLQCIFDKLAPANVQIIFLN